MILCIILDNHIICEFSDAEIRKDAESEDRVPLRTQPADMNRTT